MVSTALWNRKSDTRQNSREKINCLRSTYVHRWGCFKSHIETLLQTRKFSIEWLKEPNCWKSHKPENSYTSAIYIYLGIRKNITVWIQFKRVKKKNVSASRYEGWYGCTATKLQEVAQSKIVATMIAKPRTETME